MDENGKVILWVNIPDLQALGTLGPFGSVLNLMIQPDLGDERLDFAVRKPDALDNMFILIRCTQERASAITGALGVVGKRKMKRPVRTRTTQGEPIKGWERFTVNR